VSTRLDGGVAPEPAREPEARNAPRVVVAGVGNEYRRDDGAGPMAAARAVRRAVVGLDIGPVVDPLDLLGRWDGADLAIVIDAIRSGSTPGTVQVVEMTTAGVDAGVTSTHGVSLAGALRLAQVLEQAPARVVVIGIEGIDFGKGQGLSPAVDAAVAVAVDKAVNLIAEAYPCA